MDVKLLDTAKKYIGVFASLDMDTILPILSETYKQEFAPASCNPPPTLDRDQFAAHLKKISEVLSSFPVTPKKIWTNPLSNQVTIWADSLAIFHDYVKDNDNEDEWRYQGEYIYILSMDASGEKIEHVFEFLDSKGTEKVFDLFARAQVQRARWMASKGQSSE